ncbi:hypothetical protein AB4K20DRAFT_1867375 [Rhizopus microsporus]
MLGLSQLPPVDITRAHAYRDQTGILNVNFVVRGSEALQADKEDRQLRQKDDERRGIGEIPDAIMSLEKYDVPFALVEYVYTYDQTLLLSYGCSDKSYTKLMSKLLQIIATKVVTNNTKFEMIDFDDVFIKFELIYSQKKKPETNDESDASKTLKLLMEACQRYKKEKGEQADIMEFARSYSLSPIATDASSAVSKANEKIKKKYFRASSELIRLKICVQQHFPLKVLALVGIYAAKCTQREISCDTLLLMP